MKLAQVIVWGLTVLAVVGVWILGSGESLSVKLLQTVVVLIVGNMLAALTSISRQR